jgi:hypothetical protein
MQTTLIHIVIGLAAVGACSFFVIFVLLAFIAASYGIHSVETKQAVQAATIAEQGKHIAELQQIAALNPNSRAAMMARDTIESSHFQLATLITDLEVAQARVKTVQITSAAALKAISQGKRKGK